MMCDRERLVFIRTPYNYDRLKASLDSSLACTDPSRARQEFGEETEINFMLSRFGVTGSLSMVSQQALQGAFEDVGDYRTLLDLVKAADEAFFGLPADARRDFDNDPAKFCDFAADPANIEAMRKYGLAPSVTKTFGLKDVVEAIERNNPAYKAE